jgi:hypothetical protein
LVSGGQANTKSLQVFIYFVKVINSCFVFSVFFANVKQSLEPEPHFGGIVALEV